MLSKVPVRVTTELEELWQSITEEFPQPDDEPAVGGAEAGGAAAGGAADGEAADGAEAP